MNTLIKADFFFFITTIAIIIITVALIVIAIYLIRILRDFKKLSSKVKEEGEEIVKDVHAAREEIKSGGKGIMFLIKNFLNKKGGKK